MVECITTQPVLLEEMLINLDVVLCLGSLHNTRTTPSRLTILQLRHIFLTEARTFIAYPFT